MQRERILVLEENAKDLVENLQKQGFEVVTAKDPSTALEEIKQNNLDLCILSYRQEENKGISLAKTIRELRPSVPIVFIGAEAEMDEFLTLMKTGPVDFLGDYSHPVLVNSTIKRNLLAQRLGPGSNINGGNPYILIVDDDDIIREGLTSILNEVGLNCKTAASADEALRLAEKEPFNLVITDLHLPGMEGTELIKEIKDFLPDIVAIIITGCPSVESAVEAVKHSVYDYIVKPLKPDDVIQRVKASWEKHSHGLLIKQLLQNLQTSNMELEKANKKLNVLSITDGLTTLYNHRFLMDTIPLEYAKAQRFGHSLSVILVDIDNFKTVNDTFGHAVGDKVLAEVARIIKASSRDVDVTGRYGGEEFCVLLPNTPVKGAVAVAERIRSRVEAHTFKEAETPFNITVSLGIGCMSDTGATSANALLEHADMALYAAKQRGKNRVLCWEDISKETGAGIAADLSKAAVYLASPLKNLYTQSIKALVNTLEVKDGYSATHSYMVAHYASKLANRMKLSPELVQIIGSAGLLHDLGKVGVPDDVLRKKGPLSKEEFDIVKKHPEFSVRILNDVVFLRKELEIVRYHQERFDGAGYPYAIKGESIPLGARILAVCDAFEAMTANRPYRKALPVEVAVEELQRHSGTQFDPKLVKIFTESLGEILGGTRRIFLEELNKTVELPQLVSCLPSP
jgi:diguanylate cyclase (GGDEF)-like protein